MPAAAKHTALAAATLAAFAGLVALVPAGGASRDKDRDREAPTTPANVRVLEVTPTTVSVAWDPSTDNVGVEGYFVYGESGKPFSRKSRHFRDQDRAVVDEPRYTLEELRCGESTQITVVAFDASENRSDRAMATVTTAPCPDVQSPAVPSGFKQVATSANAVVLTWAPSSDDVGVVEYGVYRLLGRIATTPEPNVTLAGLSCGSTYDYFVDAADGAGNRSARATVFVRTSTCPAPSPGDATPPSTPTNLLFENVTQSALVLSWTKSTDNVSVTGYDVYRNGAKVASPATPSASQSGLTCGTSYTFGVAARDAAGNASAQARRTVSTNACASPPPPPSGDTTPPSTPVGLAASNLTATGVTLSWNASTDNVAVAGYDLYRNGAKVASPTTTSASQSSLTCGTSYTFGVAARDGAGNVSAQTQRTVSTNACASTGDTTPPSTPVGLAASNLTATGVTLSWNASTDNVAVAGYDLYRNGAKVASPTTTSASQSSLTCGTSYTFGVAARDGAGNVSTLALLTAATAACAPPPPPSDTTPPSTPGNLRIVGVTPSSASLAWSPSTDNVAMAGYESFVDGAWAATTVQPSATVSNLECGRMYRFEVRAFDAQGNESPRASVSGATAACPDTQPPSAPANLIATSRTATSIALSWAASSDNVGVAGYGLYRGGAGSGTSATPTAIFAGLACNTNYTLAVDAYDGAGNRSSKATVMVATTACPDTNPPSMPTGLAASNVSQTGLTLSWNAATDNVGVTGYEVYRNGTMVATPTSTSVNPTGLACGTSYSFGVEALDAADNRSSRAAAQFSTSACPVPPPPTTGPVTITAGGTYTGNWTSTSSTPAVTIATSAPVTIVNSTVSNLAGGTLIHISGSAQANVTIDRVRAYGGAGRFVYAEAFKSVAIRNCTIEKTSGIDFRWPVAASNVSVTRNRMRNIQPGATNAHRQFVQFNDVKTATVDVSWNEVINTYGESRVEDTISLYKSSNARVHDNYIHGGYPLTTGSSHSGMGIIVDGVGANLNKIYNNQVVAYTNGGLAISSGNGNEIYGNRVVSDGKSDAGVAFVAANVGIYIRNYASDPGWGSNSAHDNVLGFMHYGSPLYRNDSWLPDCSGACSNTAFPAGSITKAQEDAEWAIWQTKLANNGIDVGA